jgi:adenylate kinase family enzyme
VNRYVVSGIPASGKSTLAFTIGKRIVAKPAV